MKYRCIGSAYVLSALTLLGCEQRTESLPTTPRGLGASSSQSVALPSDAGGEFPVATRATLDFRATGAFTPNSPIVFHATAQGKRATQQMHFEILTDDDSVDVRQHGPKMSASEDAALPLNASHEISATVRFSRPGYYRVMARAVNLVPTKQGELALRDSLIQDVAASTLYVLIDSAGGSASTEYDLAVIDSLAPRLPARGAFGAFRPNRRYARRLGARRGATASAGFRNVAYVPPRPGATAATALGATEQDFSFHVRYTRPDIGGYEGIERAYVYANCFDADDNFTSGTAGYTDVNGDVTVPCYNGAAYLTWSVELSNPDFQINDHVDLHYGVTGTAYATDDSPIVVDWTSNTQAFANNQMQFAIPKAKAKFSPYSRSQLIVDVFESGQGPTCNPSDATVSCYRSSTDRIYLTANAIYQVGSNWGYSVAAHEYGHAFEYKAIEPWGTGTACPSTGHNAPLATTRYCAWTEGFAEFFAAYTIGDKYNGSYYSESELEANSIRSLGSSSNGIIIEGLVAATLLDLVDNASSPDAYTGDDESVAKSGAWLASLIVGCDYSSTTRVDAIDELLACATANTSERLFAPSAWQSSWISASFAGSRTADVDASKIRQIWLYDLYNQGSLP